jgi:hypothetical protein
LAKVEERHANHYRQRLDAVQAKAWYLSSL